MTKAELIEKLALNSCFFSHKDIDRMINEIFDCISQSLADGDRVEIRGFGSFSLHFLQQRNGRNPRTGQQVQLNAKAIPHFKMGKHLKEQLNQLLLLS